MLFIHFLLASAFKAKRQNKTNSIAGVFWRDSGGEGERRGRTQKYQLRYNSITASIEREEKGETLPGVPLHQPRPAACYKSWIKSYGPALRMSSLNQTVRDPIHFKPVIWSPYLIWSAFVIYYERECDGVQREEAVLRSFWLDAVFFPNLCTPLHPFPSSPGHQLLFNWWHREMQNEEAGEKKKRSYTPWVYDDSDGGAWQQQEA